VHLIFNRLNQTRHLGSQKHHLRVIDFRAKGFARERPLRPTVTPLRNRNAERVW
jgi:hypothetical protein